MHKCFDDVLEKVKSKVEEQYKSTDHEDLKVKWTNEVFGLNMGTGRMSTYVSFPIEYSLRRKKNNGQPYRNLTKDQIGVKPSYCPFCGEKLEAE